ncbi:hypothetical protein BFP72_03530 [Reichenbachiella sp. 5M10]|uniref:putative type IX secretion system sortase PorU2 n=1 Tax=Reichenbachiella sp. 5M10 TaxID=1889772 RepID=UPI000C15594B|nr:C25 family cysteine peptidase [Reichenbachiella sp. 5M10]PIB34546.1 hypothetical protein BFP72_03530 [Reichenbachiella sp. 5M10]
MTKNKLHLLILLAVALTCHSVLAQPYGNEWINHNQSYFKITIAEDGIYQLTRAQLAAAGIPVGSIDPRKFQMYHLGQEIALWVEGQQDGVFNSGDYIAFYGQKNDGTTDTPLYVDPSAQPHTYYNLFSDSSAYFLTYRLDLNFGKRITEFSENNIDGLPTESYYIEEKRNVFSNTYYEGQSYGFTNETILGSYDFYEGWTGTFYRQNQSITHTLTGLTPVVQGGYTPSIEMLLSGGNNNAHEVDVYVGPNSTSLRLIETASFNKDENYLINQPLQWTDISAAGDLYIQASIKGVNGAGDRVAMAYTKVLYSKGFDFNNSSEHHLLLPTSTQGKSYIEVQNSLTNILLYDITTPSDPVQIGLNEFVSEFNAIIPNTDIDRSLYAQSGYKTVGQIQATSFRNFDPSQYNYLIISHSNLHANTSDGQPDQIAAYSSYRETLAGGGHQVLALDIDMVFDQFNYGLPSPLAIRRFCEYMYDQGAPEFLFLIGKSSNVQASYYRQDPNTATVRHLVPTFGYPGGDAEFSTGLDGGAGYETIATGRINATEPDHVQAYLDKMIEEESLPYDNLRKKNLIHLSGGNSEQELKTFKTYINGFAQIAADTILGGETAQISKNNNSSVELINISDEINDGAMMVTFFGHSSGFVTDIEIGLVSDPSFGYDNKGKYPTFLVNGCFAGDFFSENESFGVDWILTPDLGASAFMANSYLAFPSNLKRFTDEFYTLAFNHSEFSSLGVGQIKAETGKRYLADYGTSEANLAQVQLTNLQGDPAAKVFGANKADYALDDNLISIKTFNNEQLLATIDSFQIEFNIKNFGIYDDTPMTLQVIRTLADGTSLTYGPIVYNPTLRQDTLAFTIDNQITNAAGQNTLRVEVDPFGEVDELNETNNTASIDLFLTKGSTLNLLPTDFSIQTDPTITFFFQTSDIFSTERSFDFQIDTVSTFNSPYFSTQSMSAKVVGQISVDLNSKGAIPNETVFYWRTRFSDPLPDENDEWVTSSFSYQPGASEGWAQVSDGQLSQSNLTGLTLQNDVWDFVTTQLDLYVETYGSQNPTNTFSDTKVLLEGRNYFTTNSTHTYAHCENNTINFLAFQRQSSAPFSPITFTTAPELNPLICGVLPEYIFNFKESNYTGAVTPIDYINALSDGDKALVFSLGTLDYSLWTDAFKTALESLGIPRTTLDNLTTDDPFIFLGSKNTGQPAIEILATTTPANQATLVMPDDVIGSYDTGDISTNKIGPAKTWNSVSLNLEDSSNPADDIHTLRIYGITPTGNETLLAGNSVDLSYDLSSINASLYPYLRLDLELSDKVDFSPPQLKGWMVNYESSPEGVLLTHTQESNLALDEGEEHTASYTFWNISNKTFSDSIKVRFKLLNSTLSKSTEDSVLIAALEGGDSAQFELELQTLNNTGKSDLVVEVNTTDQYEIYTANNTLRIADYMDVSGDEYNPTLDVLFDGIKIMDGDIVSPNPKIQISMTDENQYLHKEDTLGINFYVKSPCEGCDYVRVPFSSAAVNWQPATDDQDFIIDYSPDKMSDGLYGLRVQASDASGNASGVHPYEINFEVINESTITNFYPYPNPFSLQTRFVFTLTGDTYPEDLKIQIMTVTGRVVKEIFMDELGPINIGNNLSNYAWDGRDNYGDLLANGVYLYRILIKNPGEDFKHRKTAGDKGFKNGFGKMYILR